MFGCSFLCRSNLSRPLSLTLPPKGGGNNGSFGSVFALILLSSCAGLPKPLPEDLPRAQAVWPGVTLEQLGEARGFYLRKCGACHRAYSPQRLPQEKWPAALEKMAPKAKLKPGEKENILRFLAAMAP